jgi:hypothetical protein
VTRKAIKAGQDALISLGNSPFFRFSFLKESTSHIYHYFSSIKLCQALLQPHQITFTMAIDSDSVGFIQTEQGNQDDQTKDSGSSRSIGPGDVISLDQVDLALAAKMNLVNDVSLFRQMPSQPTDDCRTIDRIGFTRYHAKLFFSEWIWVRMATEQNQLIAKY